MDGLRLGKVPKADKVRLYRHTRRHDQWRGSQEPIPNFVEPGLPHVSKHKAKRASVANLDKAQMKK